MIDHLKGRLRGGGKDFVVVECAGLGFRVNVSAATRAELPGDGEECTLRTWLQVRDGGADLFGFSSETERELFLALTGVSGVGPKSAVGVLSALGVSGTIGASGRGDVVAFTRVPGIGKKLAQRIAMELPDRLRKVSVELEPPEGTPGGAAGSLPELEAAEALVALGFPRGEAQAAAAQAVRRLGSDGSAEALVRDALGRLAGRPSGRPGR